MFRAAYVQQNFIIIEFVHVLMSKGDLYFVDLILKLISLCPLHEYFNSRINYLKPFW